MPPSARRTTIVLAVMLAAVTVWVFLSGCGQQPAFTYVGAWAEQNSGVAQLKVERSGSAWTVTDTLGQRFRCVERNGALVNTTGAPFSLKHSGDNLVELDPQGHAILTLVRMNMMPLPWPSEQN